MTSFHKSVSTAKKDQEEKKNTAVAKLEQFLLERRGARQPVDDLEEFERELHSLFATAEAEVVGHEVNRCCLSGYSVRYLSRCCMMQSG